MIPTILLWILKITGIERELKRALNNDGNAIDEDNEYLY